MNTYYLYNTINKLNDAITKLENSKNVSVMYWSGDTKTAYDSVINKLISDIKTEISILYSEINKINEFEKNRTSYINSFQNHEE